MPGTPLAMCYFVLHKGRTVTGSILGSKGVNIPLSS
jgi:hypothetical protein